MGESLPHARSRPSDFRGIALCIGCDYPLRGLPGDRCPECGREFDPSNYSTVHVGPPLGSRRRWLLRQPVWPVMLATVAMALLHFWLARFPGRMGDEPKTWAAWGWAAVLGMWLVQVCARGWVITSRNPHASLRSRRPWRWRAVPAIAVATWIMVSAQAPFRLAMLISRPWMNAMAREIRGNQPRLDYPPRWVGVFRAENIYTTTDEVGFTVRPPGGGYSLFAHRPQWPPPGAFSPRLDYLDGEWRLDSSFFDLKGLRFRAQHELATALEKKGDWSPHVLAIMIETLANNDESYPWGHHIKLAGGWRQGGRQPLRAFSWITGGRGQMRPDMRALLRAGDAALPVLRQALISHKNPAVRMRVASALSLMGEEAAPAIPELTLALSDPESLVRETAALALGMIGPPAHPAAPALAAALCDVDPWVQYNATLALRWIKPEPRTYVASIQDGLSARLGLPVTTTRPALGRGTLMQPQRWPPVPWHDVQGVTELLRLAADAGPDGGGLGEMLGATLLAPVPQPPANVVASRPDMPSYEYPIQLAVLEAIAAIGPGAKDALPALLRVLEHDGVTWASNAEVYSDRPRLKLEFAAALARAIAAVDPHSRQTSAMLAGRVERMWTTVSGSTAPAPTRISPLEGKQAASMLAVIDPGNSRAIDALLAHLPSGANDPAAWVAPGAAAMIGAGDERVVRKATQLVARGDPAGPKMFVEMGDKARAAKPELVALLDRTVRQSAALSLAAIGANEEALPVLIEMLDGTDDRAARDAAEALGKMGLAATAAVPHLRANLRREHDRAALSAVALGEIGTPEAAAALIEFLADPPKDSTANVANYAMSKLGAAAGDAAAQALAKMAQSKDGAYWAPALARVAPASKDPAALLSLALRKGGSNPDNDAAMAQAMRDFARCATFEQLLEAARSILIPDHHHGGEELLKATGEALAPHADQPRVRELLMGLYLDAESDTVRQVARRALRHPATRLD